MRSCRFESIEEAMCAKSHTDTICRILALNGSSLVAVTYSSMTEQTI